MNTRFFRVFCLLAFLLILLAAVGCRQGVEIGDLQTKSETVELGDAGSVQVEIDLAAGGLTVSGGAAELLEADFTYNVAEMEPEVAFSGDELTVTHPEVGIVGTLSERDDYRNEWDLSFNDNVPMEMLVNLGAGRGDLKLGSLALSNLGVKTGAGDATVDLTGAPSLTQLDFEMGAGSLLMDLTGDWADDLNADITAGVGDMTLQLPGSVGVRVDVKEGIGKVSASNLAKDGDSYTNDAFGESEVTLLINITAGVGDIKLEGEPAPVADEPVPADEATADEEEAQGEQIAMFDEDIAAQLQAVLEAAVASPDTNYPGAVLHVSSPDLGSWNGAAGLGEVESNTAMRPQDKFRAGSLTKPFISVVILQLVEEGLLSLDDPMTAVLPEGITGKFANSDQITVRMLLNHTGGLPDFMNLAGPEIVANLEKIWEEEEFLDFAAAQEPLFAPGEAQGYSNTDYALLGMVIEEATGRTWREEMRQRIFEPLNLENTFLPEPDDVTIPGDHAHGYADFGEGLFDATEMATASVVGAAGGQSLVTNAEDLSRFVTAVAAGELFQEAGTMGEMLTFVDWPDGNPLSPYVAAYGLGLIQAPFGSGIDGVGHSGDTAGGYHSFVFFLPAHGMTISGAVNIDDFEAGYLLIPRVLEVLVPGYAAPQQAVPEQPDLGSALQELLDAQVQEQGILGLAMALQLADGTVVGRGSGYSDPAENEAWGIDTHTKIGSVTKLFTAAVIMQLVEEGKLSLDDTIDTWFPDQPNGEEITVRMLLTHNSGIGRFVTVPEVMEKSAETWAPMDLVAEANKAGSVGEPGGSEGHYSNANYILLALITEEITGNSWDQEVQSRIIEPLDLKDTLYPGEEGFPDTVVGGYTKSDAGYENQLGIENPSFEWSAGALVSTVSDLTTFTSALFNGDLFESEETLNQMLEPLVPMDMGGGFVVQYGLGPARADVEGGPLWGHAGDNIGYAAFVGYDPATGSVVATAVNTHGGDALGPSIAALQYLRSVQPGEAESPAAQQELTPKLLAEFEAYVEQNRESLNVPGAAVAIVQGGEIVYAEGFGVKELGGDDPVTADTVFSIGSTGKAMTSMMAASLVDDGLIAWDTPLVEVMPQFQLSDEAATQQITLREAFAHTSGLPNLGPVLFFSGLPPEGYVEYLADVPLAAPPGESYAYHNEMNAVGAYAAAMAAGAEYGENLLPTYTELMQERVFDPLGMTSATFSAQEAAASPNHATPHFMGLNATLAETGLDVTPTHYWDLDTLAPAGTVRMNAPDVGRFLITMLSGGVAPDGTRIISAENLAETWTEQIAREPDPYMEQWGSALGWSTITYQGIPIISKDGNLGGFAAQMAFIPEADTGIVVLANADVFGNSLGRNVQYKLIEMLFGLEPLIDQVSAAELEGIGGASEAVSQLAAVDPETVAPFLGSYDMEGEPYTVELRDGRLWVSFGELDFVELLAAPDGSYLAISGGSDLIFAPFEFVEAGDGQITMVIFGQLELPKLD